MKPKCLYCSVLFTLHSSVCKWTLPGKRATRSGSRRNTSLISDAALYYMTHLCVGWCEHEAFAFRPSHCTTDCVCSQTQLVQYVSVAPACAHTLPGVFLKTRGFRREFLHIPSTSYECHSVFPCARAYQCQLCSAAGREESGRTGVGWVSGCPPCVYLGRVSPSRGPAPFQPHLQFPPGTDRGFMRPSRSVGNRTYHRGKPGEQQPLRASEWAQCGAAADWLDLTCWGE